MDGVVKGVSAVVITLFLAGGQCFFRPLLELLGFVWVCRLTSVDRRLSFSLEMIERV